MSILVCGGAGYIGSHNVRALLARGEEPVVIDNFLTGHRQAVPGGVRLYQGDIRDPTALDRIFAENSIEAVLHFAASSLVGESMEKPLPYFNNNVHGMQTLLEAMLRHGVDKIVFSSTAAVYGEPESVPISEDAPTRPTNPYGESKLMMERIMDWAGRAHGMRSVVLRYFNVAGALPGGEIGEDHRPESHLIPLILQVPLGQRPHITVFGEDYPTPDGTCVRDYIHVMDLAKGHVAAVKFATENKGTEVFNLGTGIGYSVMDTVNTFMEVNHVDVPYQIVGRRAGDIATCYADPAKSKEVLGWTAQETLADMCRDSWNWQQKNPEGYGE